MAISTFETLTMRHGERSVSKHQGVAGARGRYHLIRWNLAWTTSTCYKPREIERPALRGRYDYHGERTPALPRLGRETPALGSPSLQ